MSTEHYAGLTVDQAAAGLAALASAAGRARLGMGKSADFVDDLKGHWDGLNTNLGAEGSAALKGGLGGAALGGGLGLISGMNRAGKKRPFSDMLTGAALGGTVGGGLGYGLSRAQQNHDRVEPMTDREATLNGLQPPQGKPGVVNQIVNAAGNAGKKVVDTAVDGGGSPGWKTYGAAGLGLADIGGRVNSSRLGSSAVLNKVLQNQSVADAGLKDVASLRKAMTHGVAGVPEITQRGEVTHDVLQSKLRDIVSSSKNNPFKGRPLADPEVLAKALQDPELRHLGSVSELQKVIASKAGIPARGPAPAIKPMAPKILEGLAEAARKERRADGGLGGGHFGVSALRGGAGYLPHAIIPGIALTSAYTQGRAADAASGASKLRSNPVAAAKQYEAQGEPVPPDIEQAARQQGYVPKGR